MKKFDLLIIGAGPAGMSAAVTAGKAGLDVVVIDEQPAPGGQIWRDIETVAATPRGTLLGDSYLEGRPAAIAFRESGAAYEAGTRLWQIEPGFRAFVTRDRTPRVIEAKAILLATGAQERPAPVRGWHLPGVLTVGAAQILLKNAGQVPAKPVWLAGSGPLLLLYMTQILSAGGEIAGYLDTTPQGRLISAIPHLPGALGGLPDLYKGAKWSRELRRAGVKTIRHVTDLEAIGFEKLEKIRYRTASGAEDLVEAETLLLHEGVIPHLHTALSLNCTVVWRDEQDCFVPVLDEWGETSHSGIFIAGDGAGIAGAKAAALRGQIAALGIAINLGRMSQQEASVAARSPRKKLRRELALRPFLDALFRPRKGIFEPHDDTIVCRCEEITAGQIRAVVQVGNPGPNQVKAFTRAGMGPCQGRQCGHAVTRIIAEMEGRTPDEVGYYSIRPPLKPITLGELASLAEKHPPQ